MENLAATDKFSAAMVLKGLSGREYYLQITSVSFLVKVLVYMGDYNGTFRNSILV